jgi:hypothetical protein
MVDTNANAPQTNVITESDTEIRSARLVPRGSKALSIQSKRTFVV